MYYQKAEIIGSASARRWAPANHRRVPAMPFAPGAPGGAADSTRIRTQRPDMPMPGPGR